MHSRVLYPDSHDDDVMCRDCIIEETNALKEDEAYILQGHLMRGAKRMLKHGVYEDPIALKKVKTMEACLQQASRTIRTSKDTIARAAAFNSKYSCFANYSSFLMSTYKKHVMDSVLAEFMAMFWHPNRYEKWKHLLDD